jgi:insertion element IS1 protein InsB
MDNGKQNYRCKDCRRQFVECFNQYLISGDTRALIERLLVEQISLSGLCRAMGPEVAVGPSGGRL